jgi:hypothetical protein
MQAAEPTLLSHSVKYIDLYIVIPVTFQVTEVLRMDLRIRKLALQCIYIQVIKESETIFSHVRMIGFVNQSPLNSLIHRKYSCLLHMVHLFRPKLSTNSILSLCFAFPSCFNWLYTSTSAWFYAQYTLTLFNKISL